MPKTSLPDPINLERVFLTAERFASPLETGVCKVIPTDVFVSSRMADADDAELRESICSARHVPESIGRGRSVHWSATHQRPRIHPGAQ